ncbi:PFL family protein [Oenococcus oeni]|uniref:PFL family protein n=1 Tax=Oenococcus oeni TaxID=1247 RepID=UPI0008F8A55D|nr:PFL family protein [Oenococcus oeni]OIL20641.1 PFL family protein [Oenococcus oeni]OIL25557.1 PFL family protein [Oenococcus oeni]OIL41866.1 PFL family protein [Oenococcus oeni]OIM55366.1 PFL family protein [Oenococcus oeni]
MDINKINETIQMISEEHFDIRTVTMGISLLDCIGGDGQRTAEKVHRKIVDKAGKLVETAQQLERDFGVPIVNKRISVTPVSLLAGNTDYDGLIKIARALDQAAADVGVDFLGGYSALIQKGSTPTEKMLIDSLPEVLSTTKLLMSSINIASTKAGINLNAVGKMGRTIKRISEVDPLGNAKLVVFANAVEDNPFMAGAFHGVSEDDAVINVGVSGPGVVKRALETVRDRSIDVVAEKIKTTAFKITRIGQLIGGLTAKKLGLPFGIVDLSLAPTPARGDSVAEVLEEIGLEQVGTHGTTAALMLLNDAIKKGGVMASQRVGGLSGAFIPVSEDAGMIDATVAGTLSISKLEAMTSVCSVGLDMIAIPGNTPASTISAMIADEAAIGVQNNKTTAIRVIPVPGKSVGDSIDFGGLLGRAPIMPVIEKSSTAFINRGGHIPAPIHSFKN